MRALSLRLTIAFSLFILIMSASVVWLASQIPERPHIPAIKSNIDLPPANAALDPKVYSVPFCDLIRYPERYHRKLVRTRAIFDNGVDWAHLKNDACPDDDAVLGVVGAIEPNDKLVESKSRDQIGPVIDMLIRKRGSPLEVEADMVGRFYAANKNGRGHEFAILYEFQARPTEKRR